MAKELPEPADPHVASLRALQQLVNHEPERHPLVVGLIAPLGTRLDVVIHQIEDVLRQFGYQTQEIRLSALLDGVPDAPWGDLPGKSEHGYYEKRMGAGDDLREKTGSGASLAGLAVRAVNERRPKDSDTTVYLLRSIKHGDEVELLRHIYGDAFWLLAVVSDPSERREDLAESLSAVGATFSDRRREADVLIARDEDDDSTEYGQHVGDVFQKADYFLPVRRGFDCREDVERFLDGVFGRPFMTPYSLEEAMRLSYVASLRSSAAGRQVGATLVPRDGSVYATGTNEVPRPGGGQFWAGDEPDHRDFRIGFDPNPMWTTIMLEELLSRLKQERWLREDLQSLTGNELLRAARQPREDGKSLLAGIRADSITEFTRCLHAEQAAILSAAMQGVSTKGGILVTTTYPCHECAKFIVGSGIRAVVYIEPYPKSLVRQLYRDFIDSRAPMPSSVDIREIAAEKEGKIPFLPFVGFAPTRYDQVFLAGSRKQGIRTVDFNKAAACPRGDGWNEPAIDARETQAATATMRLIAITFAKASEELRAAEVPSTSERRASGSPRAAARRKAKVDGQTEISPPDETPAPDESIANKPHASGS